MFQRVWEWFQWLWYNGTCRVCWANRLRRLAALPGRVWVRAKAWLAAHRQGFQGLVIGLLLGALLAARAACQAGR